MKVTVSQHKSLRSRVMMKKCNLFIRKTHWNGKPLIFNLFLSNDTANMIMKASQTPPKCLISSHILNDCVCSLLVFANTTEEY